MQLEEIKGSPRRPVPANSPGPRPLRVLVVDDDASIRVTLGLCLEAGGHAVTSCASASEALQVISRQLFDIVFLDVRLGVNNGPDLIPAILAEIPWAKVVVITASASAETAILAMDCGAADYLPNPFTPAQVQLVIRKVLDQRKLEMKLGSLEASGRLSPVQAEDPVTTSSEMRQAIDLARRLACSDTTLLISGEPGTGKEWLARSIHAWSGRSAEACAGVECNVVTDDVLDATLFGVSTRDVPITSPVARGAAALCDGGTLILKDIGAAPLTLQPRLLRLIREREYERHNDFAVRRTDVRVVATTHEDLEKAASQNRLRRDLLMAVNIVQIELPPLRRRAQDIRLLAERFRAAAARASHRKVTSISPEALDALQSHTWPGNVGELRNVVEKAVQLCDAGSVKLEHLPTQMLCRPGSPAEDLMPLDALQEMHIRRVLQNAKSLEAAAAILGIDPATLWRRRKQYGLE